MAAFVNLPADLANPQIIEIRWFQTVTLENLTAYGNVNIFHYHRKSGSGLVDMAGIMANFEGFWQTQLKAITNVRSTDNTALGRILDDPMAPEVASGSVGDGVVTGDPLSNVLAVVVDFLTGVRGRNFRGRKHVGGLSESDTDGGDELKAAVLTAWQSAINVAMSDLPDGLGNVFTPCVLSPTLSTILGTPPIFTGADATSFVVNPILGTMRRRKEKVSS